MKLMILGGGSCQVNLIKQAKAKGHFVIVADYLENPPGALFADEHVRVSTFDIPEVLDAARELSIDGITTLGTDQPVLTAAVVSKKLGLHFYTDADLALAVTNKRVMKRRFEQHGIPMNDYRLIDEGFSNTDLEGLKFPAVLKPVDSQGQRGIFLVENADEARLHIDETLAFSRETKALIEEYYRADEITVNGWVADGRVKILSVVDRVTMRTALRIGICIAHNFPSVHVKKFGERIEKLTDDIVEALGIEEGPIYFQFLIGEDGLRVNEIAMRIGGAYEDITLPIICGADVGAMLIEYAEKGSCDASDLIGYSLESNKKFLSTQLFFLRRGRVKYITPRQDMLDLKCAREIQYFVSEEDIIGGIENATARAGYIIVEGSSRDDMMENVNVVFDRLQVLNEEGNNLVIKYDEYEGKYLFYSEE